MKYQDSEMKNNSAHTTAPVKHAVILAAGKSSRFLESGEKKPKVLLPVGGLRLMERAILTLREAGVAHFRIVLGAYREQILKEIKKSVRLKDVDVTFVECPDYEKGNGVSFGAGADGIEAPFYLTMCDHVFAPQTIVDFGVRAMEAPNLPALACDPNLAEVFDMDDATKVLSKDGKIGNIGKEIEDYDLVDTGLFYFPAGYGNKISDKVKAGALSVSNVIQQLIDETGVRCPALPNAVWQDVDYPGMKSQAEKMLRNSLRLESDGFVSKNFNRFFSTRMSMVLANLGIKPNAISHFVLFLSLIGAFFAASGEYTMVLVGAIIFQLASIFGGCDGEVARLTYQKTWWGAWYDRVVGGLRFVLFFGALGISAYKITEHTALYFGVILFGAISFYLLTQIGLKAYKEKTIPVFSFGEKKTKVTRSAPINELLKLWKAINKADLLTFIGLILCVGSFYQYAFWIAFLILIFFTISNSRAIAKTEDGHLFGVVDPIFFYLFGIGALAFLIYRMDLVTVTESLIEIGSAVFIVFAAALLWTPFNTLCISNLVDHKVPFVDLIYNQVVGNGYNTIIPLAGLGGEPYKITHLVNWLEIHEASQAVVYDRLIHSQSGILFTVINLTLTLIFVPIESTYFLPLLIGTILLGILASLYVFVMLSKAPSKISGFVLKKLKLLSDFQADKLSTKKYLTSLFYKMMYRFLTLLELYLIFRILGYQPEFIQVIMVAGFIMLSATIFFMVPQGMGVNEFGIIGALTLLGYPTALAVTFGLIRRGRMLFWSFFGIGLHGVYAFYTNRTGRFSLVSRISKRAAIGKPY